MAVKLPELLKQVREIGIQTSRQNLYYYLRALGITPHPAEPRKKPFGAGRPQKTAVTEEEAKRVLDFFKREYVGRNPPAQLAKRLKKAQS